MYDMENKQHDGEGTVSSHSQLDEVEKGRFAFEKGKNQAHNVSATCAFSFMSLIS